MLEALRRLGKVVFHRSTLVEIVTEELYQAEVQRLSLLTTREYANGLIAYRESQIARLKAYKQQLESQ
jgi:hypothetical protein